MKKEIQKLSLSAIFSALIVVMILLGTFIEVLDITVAAVCSLAICIVQIEAKGKYPFLVYLSSSVLSLIFTPLSSATLYFIGFFGYYPLVKKSFSRFSKKINKLLCVLIFNTSMLILLLLFKAVFAMQNEPPLIYALLLVTINIFFLCFDKLFSVFPIIYIRFIKSKIKFIK